MPQSASTLALAMRDALVAKFRSEMAEANPTGKLAALTNLHASAQLNLADGPAAGVAIKGWSQPEAYAHRRSMVWVHFLIVVAARSVTTDDEIANLDAAQSAMLAVLDDNAGGGIVGVLNDPTLFGLPTPSAPQGLAFESRLGEAEFASDVDDGAPQAVTAYCIVSYSAHGIFTF